MSEFNDHSGGTLLPFQTSTPLPVVRYFFAHRAKDTEEDIRQWMSELGPLLKPEGWRLEFTSGKSLIKRFMDPETSRLDWKAFTPFPTAMRPPLCEEPNFHGFVIPLAGEGGPTLTRPFVGRATAQMLERVFQMDEAGICERHVYAAEQAGPGWPSWWILHRVVGLLTPQKQSMICTALLKLA